MNILFIKHFFVEFMVSDIPRVSVFGHCPYSVTFPYTILFTYIILHKTFIYVFNFIILYFLIINVIIHLYSYLFYI